MPIRDWKSYELLVEDREDREGKDLTETDDMKKSFWHLISGKVKRPTSPHYFLLFQLAAVKVAQRSLR